MSVERARQLRKTMPGPEARLWNALRAIKPQGFHFRRQVQLGPYYADFACHSRKLVIEVDGDTHATSRAVEHDARRDAFIEALGYSILRVTNRDVLSNLDGVMTTVLVELDKPSRPRHGGQGSPAGGRKDILI